MRSSLPVVDGLSLLINIDLFVLGLFVSSWKLGVYAEAAVLARFFLVLPAAVRPIFKQHYTAMVAQKQMAKLAAAFHNRSALLFGLHAVLALLILLYFPVVLDLFFKTRGEILLSYRIFAIMVPGLIFYSVLCTQESFLEALGKAVRLKRLTIWVAAANLVLTIYLVPFGGPKGAAAATMLTMLIYFGLFGKDLPQRFRIRKYDYAIAGFSAYLVYMVLNQWGAVSIDFWLGPILLGTVFYLSGFYGVKGKRPTAAEKGSL